MVGGATGIPRLGFLLVYSSHLGLNLLSPCGECQSSGFGHQTRWDVHWGWGLGQHSPDTAAAEGVNVGLTQPVLGSRSAEPGRDWDKQLL